MTPRSFIRRERRLIRTLTPSWCAAAIAARRRRSPPPATGTPDAPDRPGRPHLTREELLVAAAELARAHPTEKVLNRHVAEYLGMPLSTVGFLAADLRRTGQWPQPGVPFVCTHAPNIADPDAVIS